MKKGLLLSTLLCGLSPPAIADAIDFGGQASGINVDDEYAPQFSVSAQNTGGGPELSVVFDSLKPAGGSFVSSNPELDDDFAVNNVMILCEGYDEPYDEGRHRVGEYFVLINIRKINHEIS